MSSKRTKRILGFSVAKLENPEMSAMASEA
jgi:hypothetical protein